MHLRRTLTLLIVLCALFAAGAYSQTSTPPAGNDSTPPANKDSVLPASKDPIPPAVRDKEGVWARENKSSMETDQRSLGDLGRGLRDAKHLDVEIDPGDAKELYAEVDKILKFASQDSGLAVHASVKRRLVGEAYVEKYFAKSLNEDGEESGLIRSELVLKKFGLLPKDFDLKDFWLKSHPQRAIGGYYVPKDKTIYLVNWMPWHAQKPIIAHELTHALQDQNFDLERFERDRRSNIARRMSVNGPDGSEREDVRRAMVEGQAMVVYVDYLLEPRKTSLAKEPEFVDLLRNLIDVYLYDLPVSFQNAPRILRDTATFPYEEGLSFEAKVLQDRGKHAAFAGMFARPPANTHEILQPMAYLAGMKPPNSNIPDLQHILGNSYVPFDSGTVGQLDVRTLARDFGRENDIYSVAEQWAGGAYVAVAKRSAQPAAAKLTTADIGLVYVSRWKSYRAAKRFAEIYKNALPKRLTVQQESVEDNSQCLADSYCKGVLWKARMITDEGPVTMELWPENNALLIVHGFEESTVSRLRTAVLHPAPTWDNMPAGRELSMKLLDSEDFVAFQNELRQGIMQAIETGLNH